MSVVILMLAVTACYTICSLNDKYAAAQANFSGDEFTFLMCSSMSVFLAASLPFQNLSFSFTWQSFLAVLLVAACKMLEFQMSARVLKQLSAFELKAWLGITLFASYFTDIFFGSELSVIKLICIFATASGLVFIAKSSKCGSVYYKQIILPLVLYLVSKYGYGLVIRSFSPYASSTMQLLPAMVIISLIMLPRVHIRELIKQCNGDSGRKGSNYVSSENNGQKPAQTRNENPRSFHVSILFVPLRTCFKLLVPSFVRVRQASLPAPCNSCHTASLLTYHSLSFICSIYF